jgi:hypothetical protein
MIYLIGGVPRVGKSTLSQKILETKKISWVSLDLIRQMLFKAAPELKLQEGENWWDTTPDKFYPFLKELVRDAMDSKVDHVFEGDTFFPKHIAELQKEFPVKACFLGTSHITLKTLKENPGIQNWLDELPQEKLEAFPEWMMEKSKMFKEESERYNIPYFDTGVNHKEALEKAYHSLFIE